MDLDDSCTPQFDICFSSNGCIDGETSTATCWTYIMCQLMLMILLMFVFIWRMKTLNVEKTKSIAISTDISRIKNALSKYKDSDEENQVQHSKKDTVAFILNDIPKPLKDTFRSAQNFMRPNRDRRINQPSDFPPEYMPLSFLSTAEFTRTILYCLKNDAFWQIGMLKCTILSVAVNMCSSLIAMMHKYEQRMTACFDADVNSTDNVIQLKEWIMGQVQPFSRTMDSFKFLPIFLLLGYVAFLVDRWRSFMVTCHKVCGRLHDIGVLVGSIPYSDISDEEKLILYKIYRLMNTLHILVYKPRLREEFKNDDDLSHLVFLKILTESEAEAFTARGKKLRDSICSSLLSEIDKLLALSSKQFLESKAKVINEKVCMVRGTMAEWGDLFLRDNPNEYILGMRAVVSLYTILIVVGYPITLYSDTNASYNCVQPSAFFGTFITLLSIKIPFLLFWRLEDPFVARDGIGLENLIASTEMNLFQSLRSSYCDDIIEDQSIDGNTRFAAVGKMIRRDSQRNTDNPLFHNKEENENISEGAGKTESTRFRSRGNYFEYFPGKR
ncbi:hypothetical protein CTEN210_06532 [Chaetoceros tenuissimus]|uniref:Uncharacterized protein n=1 Tax=Chaetoceros tenuissimus TaxID=426638 RepID=A0AAD3H4J1_9STRA|nr:hypothetical protein CTEN210_06532 [Chaetoceros tenuissimus]